MAGQLLLNPARNGGILGWPHGNCVIGYSLFYHTLGIWSVLTVTTQSEWCGLVPRCGIILSRVGVTEIELRGYSGVKFVLC